MKMELFLGFVAGFMVGAGFIGFFCKSFSNKE